jgi:amidohydrolase
MDEEWRKEAHKQITKIAKSIAEGMGAKCDVNIVGGYPALINDIGVTKQASEFAKEYLGKNKVEDMEIRMTGEDFAYFSEKYPSTFYRLGTMNSEEKTNQPLHSPNFNIDEDAMRISGGLMAWLAYKFLNN